MTQLDIEYQKEKIFDTVCEVYGVTMNELKLKSRKRSIVEPRQIIMYFINKKTPLILKEIGSIFNTDHSDVIYARKTVENISEANKIYYHRIKYIESLI